MLKTRAGEQQAAARGARPGNMTVAVMLIVLVMASMTAGIHTLLSTQIDNASQMQKIGLAKIQATYLAEMGLNQVMFQANQSPDAAQPFPVTTTPGQATTLDFKNEVALVSGLTGGAATCTVAFTARSATTASFQVNATLAVPPAGTFNRTLEFTTNKLPGTGQPWVLTGYQVVD